jgi:hypothetical protein
MAMPAATIYPTQIRPAAIAMMKIEAGTRAKVANAVSAVGKLLGSTPVKRVHYVILTSRPLEDSTVVGWQEKIAQQPTCGGAPDGHGSHYLF